MRYGVIDAPVPAEAEGGTDPPAPVVKSVEAFADSFWASVTVTVTRYEPAAEGAQSRRESFAPAQPLGSPPYRYASAEEPPVATVVRTTAPSGSSGDGAAVNCPISGGGTTR